MMCSLNLGRRPKYQKLLLELVLSFSQKSQLMMKERGRERTVWNPTPTSRKCGIRVRRIRVVPCDIPPSFDCTHQQKKAANKERENKITKQRASGNTHILSASHAQTLDLLNWVCCCCLIRSAESFRGWPHIIDHSLLLLPTFFSSSRNRCHRCDLLCCWWSLLQKFFWVASSFFWWSFFWVVSSADEPSSKVSGVTGLGFRV